jgi:hypothetical protein
MADPYPLIISQHGVKVAIAGKLPATRAETTGTDRVLGITDTASPLH